MGQFSDYFENELKFVQSHPLVAGDDVNQPSHYQIAPGIEAKDIIKAVLDAHPAMDTWDAYCLGTFLKYRLRAGDKDDLQKDINKSNIYRGWLRDSLDN
jgi:hypothetical protein